MASEKDIVRLEKEIFIKMHAIKNKKLLPKDSGIGKLFLILKGIDEVSYNKYISQYKEILNGIK